MTAPHTDYDTLRRLLRIAPSFMAVLRGPKHVFELTNDAYRQVVGHRDLIGLPVREALPEIAGQGFYELLDRVFASGEPYVGHGIEIDLQRVPDGPMERAYLDFIYQPMLDKEGRVEGIFVEGHDVTEKRRAELAAQAATMRVRLALEAAEIGIWEAEIRGVRLARLLGDERARELMGAFGDVETDGEQVVPFRVAGEDRAALSAAIRGALDPDTDEFLDIEYRVRDAGGKARWLHLRAQVDDSAHLPKLVGTVRDVTDLKDTEVRQAVLRGELAHRIKNTLTVVMAIASQTLRGPEVRAMRDSFAGRIAALAEAQNILTAEAQKSAPLGALTRSAVLPHADRSRFRIDGPETILGPRQAVAFALAMHELATNAVKYGALSNDTGTVEIAWTCGPAEDPNAPFVWTWREAGGPPVAPPGGKGFGSNLIGPALAAEIGGTAILDYPPEGVTCQVTTTTERLNPPSIA